MLDLNPLSRSPGSTTEKSSFFNDRAEEFIFSLTERNIHFSLEVFISLAHFLGLKIVGGRLTEKGTYAAYITKVKKGSIADTAGHLRAGKKK